MAQREDEKALCTFFNQYGGNVGPVLNHFPGNNRAATVPLFNMLPECQWVIRSNI